MFEGSLKAVVLDLFDTLVNWEPSRLPAMEWHGRRIRSTIPWILPLLESALGNRYEFEAFVTTYMAVIEEINAERERDEIEISCFERFTRTLIRLGLKDDDPTRALARTLTREHMRGVRSVTSAPPARIEAVKRLARRYRLGMISNFDDSAAGHEILLDSGVSDLFEAVIISADVGLRKPNPLIFERMLAQLNLGAHEILFVGDMPRHDVAGAKRTGMHAAWISRDGLEFPEELPQADLVIKDLAELPALLGC